MLTFKPLCSRNAIQEQLAVAILRAPKSARPARNIGGGIIAPTPSTYRGQSEIIQSQLVALMHSNSDLEASLQDRNEAS